MTMTKEEKTIKDNKLEETEEMTQMYARLTADKKDFVAGMIAALQLVSQKEKKTA